MSSMSERHLQQHQSEDNSDMECTYAHEEQAFYTAVNEVKSFIERGDVSYEQVEKILRGKDDTRQLS